MPSIEPTSNYESETGTISGYAEHYAWYGGGTITNKAAKAWGIAAGEHRRPNRTFLLRLQSLNLSLIL
jgi:hypothetical protein